MNEEELKEELLAAGASEDMFDKIDFSKKIKTAFPDFDKTGLFARNCCRKIRPHLGLILRQQFITV